MSAEVSVTLKLLTDSLQAQAKKAAKDLNIAFNAEAGKTAAQNTDKATVAQDKLEKQAKKTTSALQKQLEEWRKLNAGGVAPDQKIIFAAQNLSKRLSGNPLQGQAGGNTGAGLAVLPNLSEQASKVAKAFKDITANLSQRSGLKNRLLSQLAVPSLSAQQFPNLPKAPAPPNYQSHPLTNMLQRQMLLKPALPNVAFPKLPNAPTGGQNQLKAMLAAALGTGVGGPIGGAVAGLLTKANPAIAAVTAAMTALRFAVIQVAAAYDNARKIYAKTIQSGFGLGQTVQRGMLANAIGVSENEIYAFGAAIGELNDKMSVAMRTITQTTPLLNEVAWNFSVLQENLKAVWASIAAAVAPAINRLLELVGAMAKLFVLSGMATLVGRIFELLIEGITRLVAITSIMVAAAELAATAIEDAFKNMIEYLNNLFASTRVGKMLGFKEEKQTGFQNTKDASKAFGEVLKSAFGTTSSFSKGAPTPQAYMKQMPASSWERMGLNVGGGGGSNYAQKTEANTKKTSVVIEKLLAAVQKGSLNITKPMGVPSTA